MRLMPLIRCRSFRAARHAFADALRRLSARSARKNDTTINDRFAALAKQKDYLFTIMARARATQMVPARERRYAACRYAREAFYENADVDTDAPAPHGNTRHIRARESCACAPQRSARAMF